MPSGGDLGGGKAKHFKKKHKNKMIFIFTLDTPAVSKMFIVSKVPPIPP